MFANEKKKKFTLFVGWCGFGEGPLHGYFKTDLVNLTDENR